MTWEQFSAQVTRLANTFGAQAYRDERVKLIWREVERLSPEWFSEVIDTWIGTMRTPPLLPEITAAVAIERERLWQLEKRKNAREAETAMNNLISAEDRAMMFGGIRKRTQGGMDDKAFSSFKTMLAGLGPKPSCRTCEDTGQVFVTDPEGYEWLYRCACRHGHRQPKAYPVYRGGRA